MTDIRAYVKQQSRAVASDGSWQDAAQFREGGLVTGDITSMYQHWLREGRVFEAHFATEAGFATLENNTAVDLTEPFWRCTVPAANVMVPIRLKVSAAVVWETGDEYVLYTSDTDTYSAGGAASDVRNLAIVSSTDSALRTSVLTNVLDGDTALTESAVTNPRILDAGHFLTGGLYLPYEYNVFKGDPTVYIHGASSLCLMIARTTTTVECFYSMVWAELDKASLVNS